LGLANRRGFLHQDQEGGLEGIFGFVRIPEQLAANAKDHRAMPLDQRFESRLVVVGDKTFQELSVGPVGSTNWMIPKAAKEIGEE
jgi:hypothetical protein